MPDPDFDPGRFSHDPAYARRLANANLLTYLIDNRDSRGTNLLISTDPANPQVFSVDNGIAFGGVVYNFFRWHIDEIRVGGLPRQAIDRLRRVTAGDLARLGALGQLEADSAGVLCHVTPSFDYVPSAGVRLAQGVIQYGLTDERRSIWWRGGSTPSSKGSTLASWRCSDTDPARALRLHARGRPRGNLDSAACNRLDWGRSDTHGAGGTE